MKNALARLAMPVSAAFILSACATPPSEPEMTAEDMRDAVVQFAIMQVSAQGYSIGSACKNADRFESLRTQKLRFESFLFSDISTYHENQYGIFITVVND